MDRRYSLAANHALELIGKQIGIFVERKAIGISDLRNASAEDLMRIIAELESEFAMSHSRRFFSSRLSTKEFTEFS